jgi:hypothetical protein
MIKKVKGAAGNKIYHVLDTVAVGDTQFTSVKVLAEDKPGKVVTLLPLAEGVQDVRKDSQVTSSSHSLPILPKCPRAADELAFDHSDFCFRRLRFQLRWTRTRRQHQAYIVCVPAEGPRVDQRRKAEEYPCEEVRRGVGKGRQRWV